MCFGDTSLLYCIVKSGLPGHVFGMSVYLLIIIHSFCNPVNRKMETIQLFCVCGVPVKSAIFLKPTFYKIV